MNRDACWIAAGDITACPTGTGNGTVASGAWSRFSYTPDRARYKQVTGAGATQGRTTTYVGSLFEKDEVAGGGTEYRHYIRGSGRVVAVFTRTVTAANATTNGR